jgi:methionine-rich copper-binding protein CopC
MFKPERTRAMRAIPNVETLFLAATLGLAATGTAFAHAHLKSAVPADNETVAKAPATLQLKFSEGVDLAFTGVAVTGPGKATVQTGTGSHTGGDDATLSVPVSGQLAPGRYTVTWHAVATDGHKTNGSYSFIVKP